MKPNTYRLIIIILVSGYIPFLYNELSNKATAKEQSSDPVTNFQSENPIVPSSGGAGGIETSPEKSTPPDRPAQVQVQLSELEEIINEEVHESYELRDLNQRILDTYPDLFEAYGLSGQDTQELMGQLLDIERSRILARSLLDEVEYKKQRYDALISEKIGSEQYADYLKNEQQKPLNHYLKDMESHLISVGQPPLSAEQSQALVDALEKVNGGITIDRSEGPYGQPTGIGFSALDINSSAGRHYLADQESLLRGEQAYLKEAISDPKLLERINEYYETKVFEFESFSN